MEILTRVGLRRRVPPTFPSSARGFHRVGQRPLREIFLSRPHPLKTTDDPGGVVPTIEKILISKSKIQNHQFSALRLPPSRPLPAAYLNILLRTYRLSKRSCLSKSIP
jgi:hypothetical protein